MAVFEVDFVHVEHARSLRMWVESTLLVCLDVEAMEEGEY